MDAKRWWESKTLWFNVIACVLVAVQALDGAAWLDPKLQGAIIALCNVALRIITNQPIEIKGN